MTTEALWLPNPGPQSAFVGSPVKDLCYGGARYGGKSIALFLAFREYAYLYGKAARGVIFRKTYTELEDMIIKGRDWLVHKEGWVYNATSHTFTCVKGPGTGATLVLRYLRTMEDARVYAGHEYPWQGFDEIENWPSPEPIDLLMGSMRSGVSKIPTYRRSTCMPGGPGHVWVKERYQPDEPWVIRKRQLIADRPDLTIDTLFIPAKLEDNPKADRAQYEVDLAAVGNEKLYKAWRYGMWDLVAGAFFDCWDEDVHVIDEAEHALEPWHQRWMSMDWGFKDDCIVGWHSIDERNVMTTYHELRFNDTPPKDVGRALAKVHVQLKVGRQILFAVSPDAWSSRGSSPKVIADQVNEGVREVTSEIPYPIKADNDREGGWMLLYQLMKSKLYRCTKNCVELRRSIPALQHAEKNSADVEESSVEHAPEMLRYGAKTYIARSRVPEEERLRRMVAERIPALALPTKEFEQLDEVTKRNAMNALAFTARREEKRKTAVRRRVPWRLRIGA